jgi:hypothetical protein
MPRITATFRKGDLPKRVEFKGNYFNDETTHDKLRGVIIYYLKKRVKSSFPIPYILRMPFEKMNPNTKAILKKDAQMLINIQMKKSTIKSQRNHFDYLKDKYGFVFHFKDDGELTKHGGGSFINQLESIVNFYGNSLKHKTAKRKVSNLNKTNKNNFVRSINEEEEENSFSFDKNNNFVFGKFGEFEDELNLSISKNNKIELNNYSLKNKNKNKNGNSVLKNKEI